MSRLFSLPLLRPALVAVCVAPLLSGCVWLAATGMVAGVSAARQERTVGNAVDDLRIKSRIESRLVGQSPTLFLNVSVTVIEGRVLLTGRVADPQTRIDATRVAWSIEGVRKVDNEIEVTDETGWLDRPKDIYIRTRLAAILLGDKTIRDVNYTIDTVNGVVYLTGIAQDQSELERVIAHARNMDDVRRVENYVLLKDDPARYGFGSPSPQPASSPVSSP